MKITNKNEVDICDVDYPENEIDDIYKLFHPEAYTVDDITNIIKKYTTFNTELGSAIQFVSEALEVNENVAEWMINQFTKVNKE